MIVVVDYGMGNLRSVEKALETVTSEEVKVSSNPEDIRNADKIVLPGVGAFGDGMKNLEKLSLIKPLREVVIEKKKPFLGICLGMQLLADEGFEHGNHKGLGFIPGKVTKFNLDSSYKVPHVGWNNIDVIGGNSLLSRLVDFDFYFVHSFHLECDDSYVAAKCNYGYDFVAAIKKENIFATQFHLEKSQHTGLRILENFVEWDGS